MRLKIPFVYSVEVIPPRCRKPRKERRKDHFSATFREVTGAEAPVAFTRHGKVFNSRKKREVPEDTVYRWYDGTLWTLVYRDTSPHLAPVYESQTAESFRTDPYPFSLAPIDLENPQWWVGQNLPQDEFKAYLRAWAKETLFVDGLRYKKALLPCYRIVTYRPGRDYAQKGPQTVLTTVEWRQGDEKDARIFPSTNWRRPRPRRPGSQRPVRTLPHSPSWGRALTTLKSSSQGLLGSRWGSPERQ